MSRAEEKKKLLFDDGLFRINERNLKIPDELAKFFKLRARNEATKSY